MRRPGELGTLDRWTIDLVEGLAGFFGLSGATRDLMKKLNKMDEDEVIKKLRLAYNKVISKGQLKLDEANKALSDLVNILYLPHTNKANFIKSVQKAQSTVKQAQEQAYKNDALGNLVEDKIYSIQNASAGQIASNYRQKEAEKAMNMIKNFEGGDYESKIQ